MTNIITSWLHIGDLRRSVQCVTDACTRIVIDAVVGTEYDGAQLVTEALRLGYLGVISHQFPEQEYVVRDFRAEMALRESFGTMDGFLTKLAMVTITSEYNSDIAKLIACSGDTDTLEIFEQSRLIEDGVFRYLVLMDGEYAYKVLLWAYTRGYAFGKSVIGPMLDSRDPRVRELVIEHMFDDIVDDCD